MKKRKSIRVAALVLTLTLTGCGNKIQNTASSSPEMQEKVQNESADSNNDNRTGIPDITEVAENKENSNQGTTDETRLKAEEEIRLKAEEEARIKAEEEKKLAEQRNSFSMMCYLAITAEEIRTSKNNRLILEDIYTSLLNDINPGAVDEITQDHLKNLRDIIKSYLDISVKRERLQFIYNQEKASAMRSAIPDPLAILSVSNALDWRKLALTVTYTAVDSYNNYKRASENADMAFIMSGWELDDEEKEAVMKNRDRAFDYMVDMVQEYHLDGLKTLNEKSIKKFAEICATQNASERIKLLKAEEYTYSVLGNYWLELADAYFETSQYLKCLECVDHYNNLAMGIYRQDFNYLQILPKVIVAAQESYSGERYVTSINGFADAIIENTSTDDWCVRYFAAQVYLDLYSKTNDSKHLEKAYKIASENVTVLLKQQRLINSAYLSDVVEETVAEPDYRYMTDQEKKDKKKEYKDEQKRVKQYNKTLKENRKTELPSLYEPLVLNCELLFELADQMNINSSEKTEIESILETDNNGIFIIEPINDAYSFTSIENRYSMEFYKDEMIIPANLMTEKSKVTVTINEKDDIKIFDDCIVTKVEREGDTIDTFMAHLSSKQLKKYDWTADSRITILITYGDAYNKTVSFKFAVSTFEEHWYGDKVVFSEQ
ncbi:MAG: hypothetical protein HFG70_01340 [Hungatella sp.]|nr:hypothetical protein [Hungatella sp.]